MCLVNSAFITGGNNTKCYVTIDKFGYTYILDSWNFSFVQQKHADASAKTFPVQQREINERNEYVCTEKIMQFVKWKHTIKCS